MNFRYLLKIPLIMMMSMVLSDVTTVSPWNLMKSLYPKKTTINFRINHYDDRHNSYDYQEGSVTHFSDEDSLVRLTSPLTEKIWLKKDIVYEYNEALETTRIINVNDYKLNAVYDFLLSSLKQVQQEYTIKSKQTNDEIILELSPVVHHRFLSSINIYIDRLHNIKKIIFLDKFHYKAELIFTANNNVFNIKDNIIFYPKSVEVLKYVRHTVI